MLAYGVAISKIVTLTAFWLLVVRSIYDFSHLKASILISARNTRSGPLGNASGRRKLRVIDEYSESDILGISDVSPLSIHGHEQA